MKKIDQIIVEWDFFGTGRVIQSKRRSNLPIRSLTIQSVVHTHKGQRPSASAQIGFGDNNDFQWGFCELFSKEFLGENNFLGGDFWLQRNESLTTAAIRMGRAILTDLDVEYTADILGSSRTFEHLLAAFSVRQRTWVQYRRELVPIEVYLREKHHLPPPRPIDKHHFGWGRRDAAEDVS